MILKDIVFEDFANYKLPSMFLIFPTCNFKCCIESGNDICQNMSVAKLENKEVDINEVISYYLTDKITSAVVLGGLEPMDSFDSVVEFISLLRKQSTDTVVIYTGYKEVEVKEKVKLLSEFKNIIIKFGRYLPGYEPHLDDILGIELASPNQYAKVIS